MINLSRPNRRTLLPDRGDFVKTDGGAFGLYVGTTSPGGVQVVYYPEDAKVTFQRDCDAFDQAQRARDRLEILRRAAKDANEAFGYGLRHGHDSNLGLDRSPLMIRATDLGSDYRAGRVKWTPHENSTRGGYNCMCAACRIGRLVDEATH
jgi:hypothetical protein